MAVAKKSNGDSNFTRLFLANSLIKPFLLKAGVAITFNGDTNFAAHKSNGDNGQAYFTRNNIGPATLKWIFSRRAKFQTGSFAKRIYKDHVDVDLAITTPAEAMSTPELTYA